MARKTKQRTSKRTSGVVSQIRNRLFKGNDIQLNLLATIKAMPISELHQVYNIANQRGVLDTFKRNLFPSSLKDIKSGEEVFVGSDDTSIAWASVFFIDNWKTLEIYLNERDRLENATLLSDFDTFSQCIETIEQHTCQSIWLNDKKILLASERDGLKRQKEITVELKEQANDFVSSMFHFISCKNEEKVTASWFENTVNKITSEFNEEYRSYLKLKFCGLDKNEPGILSSPTLDSNTSIIDYYESFIRSLQSYLSEYKNHDILSKDTIKYIQRLSLKVNDYRLKNILLCLDSIDDEIAISRTNDTRLKLIESYVKGEFDYINEEISNYLNKNPSDIFICEIYAKSIIRENKENIFKNNLIADIINNLIALYERGDNFSKAISRISKICLKHSDLNFRYQLNYVLIKEIELIKGKYTQYENISLLNQRYICPRVFTLTNRDDTLDTLLKHFGDLRYDLSLYSYFSLHSNKITSIEKELERLPNYRKYSNIALYNYNSNNYDNAITNFELAIKCGDEITNKAIFPYYIISLIKSGDLIRASSKIVDLYLGNPQLHILLPIKECCEELGFFNWPNSIDIVILFYIYNENISKDKVELMRYSFEYFITNNGYKYPSDLEVEDFNLNKVIFFFEKICTYEVMKRFPGLKSTTEIDKERIAVLNKLRIINDKLPEKPINDILSEKYINEIRDLTKGIVVKDGVKKAVQSKIYVDTENIKSSMKEEISEYLERYKALVVNKVSFIDISHLARLMSDQKTTYSRNISNFINNSYADDNILASILRKVFYEFLKGEFGLNSYLSSRIRHGTLLNTLSKPLISENLLTYMDNGNRKYSETSNWFKQLEKIDSEVKEEIIENVSILSNDFNCIVENLKSKKIQISVDKSISNSEKDYLNDALFNFSLTENDLVDIMSAISNETSYSELMNILFEHFWQKVENELASARDFIRYQTTQEINKAFEKCLKDTRDRFDNQYSKDLIDSLNRSRIGMHRALSEVEGWLNRQESGDVNDFNLSIPLDIAVKMITGFESNNQCSIFEDIDDSLLIKGNYLIYFVDIFYPLIDNVIQRSGLPPDSRNINVLVTEDIGLNLLIIKVTNPVSKRENIKELNESLTKKIQDHLDDHSPQMLTQEGGSGFYKIIKTVKNSLKSRIYSIKANFIDEETFEFDLVLECGWLRS